MQMQYIWLQVQKKEVTLHKHINTKHKNVRCKVCFNKFVSTIMMLQHMDEQYNSIDNNEMIHKYAKITLTYYIAICRFLESDYLQIVKTEFLRLNWSNPRIKNG